MKLIFRLGLFVAVGLLLPDPRGSAQTLRLRESVEVRSGEITLLDLLPDDCPPDLRAMAANISVGRSPNLGTIRRMDGVELAHALSTYTSLLSRLSIPREILVSRRGTSLAQPEIAAALKSYLDERGQRFAISPAELKWTASLRSPTEVKVLHMLSTAQTGQLYFLLGCVPARSCLDFVVEMPATRRSNEKLPSASRVSDMASGPSRNPAAMRAGMVAWMIIEGDGIRLRMRVTCLQRGSIGQSVRVRDNSSHRIFVAQITGSDEVVMRLDS